ncbi:hypothetical protein ACWGCW_06805, partial [Streptomyces sp. NPDC054933]
MFRSMSAIVLLGAAIFALWRFGRLSPWHAVLCTLFGFFLASSSVGAGGRAPGRAAGRPPARGHPREPPPPNAGWSGNE